MLDANPEDWGTLLVFADWLQDRDDPRAEAYRALGAQRIATFDVEGGKTPKWVALERYTFGDYPCERTDRSALPEDWFRNCAQIVGPDQLIEVGRGAWFGKPTAREACAVVIAAFLQLPAERRAELCERKAVAV